MNQVQQKLAELQQKGWTVAAIADEIGMARNTVEKWKAGDRNPRGQRMIISSLDGLLRRSRVPKKRRYSKGSRQQRTGGATDASPQG